MKKTSLILYLLLGISIISKADYWNQKSNCPQMRKTCFSFSIGLKGYTGCGRDSLNNLTNSFWEYNSQTNTWSQQADLAGVPREGVIGFAIGNKGYAGLGNNPDLNGPLQDFYEYNPDSNTWIRKAFFQGLGSAYSASFAIGNYGYVCTGTSMTQDYQELWQYDPSTDAWNQMTGIPAASRRQAVGVSIGNNGYIIGGYSVIDSMLMNDFWLFNPTTNTWTQKANTPGHPRCDAAAFTIFDKVYFGIGDTSGGDLKDFWQYDTTTNIWSQKADFPGIRRDEATYFVIANKGYIGLGGDDGSFTDFWEYTPDSTTGIPTIPNKIKTTLTPTPFTDKAKLNIEGNPVNATLNIYTIQGQKIRSHFLTNTNEFIITRDHLAQGIYLYELQDTDSQTIATGKMVVE